MEYKDLEQDNNSGNKQSLIKSVKERTHSIYENIPLEKKRWLILLSFGFLSFTNASGFVAYAPILETVEEYYGISESQAIWFSNTYYIVYIVGSLFVIFMYNWRFDACVYASSFFNALGGLVRYLGKNNFGVGICGAILFSISQLWILPGPAIMSEIWFGPDEKLFALSLAFFINILGLSYGYLTAAYIVKSVDDMEKYLMVQGIVSAIPLLCCLAVVRNKPKVCPNQEQPNMEHKLDMIQSLKKCFLNWQNFFSVSALSLYLGVSWTFEAVLDIVLTDFNSLEIGYIGLCMNSFGTIGGLLSSVYIDKLLAKGKQPKFDLFLKIFSSISFFLVVSLTIILWRMPENQPRFLIYAICSFIGMGFNAFVPLAISSLLETIYPISEIVGVTLFNLMANVFGFAGNLLTSFGMWVICLLILPLYVYLIFFYKTQYHKCNIESSNSNEHILKDNSSENKDHAKYS